MFVSIKAKVLTDETGVYSEIPAILTSSGILEPLIDYFLHRSHDRSLEWMRKVARSVRLFLEYVQVNPVERDPHQLFQNFAQRLYTGTFNRDTGIDPTGLCWAPRSPHDAARIITHLSDFFNWLGEIRPEASTVNPRYVGGAFDRQTDEAVYQYRRNKAFLGHVWASNATPSSTAYRLRYRGLPKVARGEPPSFPERHFEALLFKGFRNGDRYDYRGILITLLLHGAGFRESEPFHLYVQDVFSDPQSPRQAKVLIHHPRYGSAPADWCDERGRPRKLNRAEYPASYVNGAKICVGWPKRFSNFASNSCPPTFSRAPYRLASKSRCRLPQPARSDNLFVQLPSTYRGSTDGFQGITAICGTESPVGVSTLPTSVRSRC